MRTPCQEAPEAWVGDDQDLRAEAAEECLSCEFFVACQRAAESVKPKFGVWAGVDYTPKNGRPRGVRAKTAKQERLCEWCEETFLRGKLSARQWKARRFCGHDCANHARRAA